MLRSGTRERAEFNIRICDGRSPSRPEDASNMIN